MICQDRPGEAIELVALSTLMVGQIAVASLALASIPAYPAGIAKLAW
jgi:hypothetical protein